MEVGRRARDGAKSAVSHGWLFARPSSMITLKMPQAPEGLFGRKRLFASVFGLFKNEGPRQGCLVCAPLFDDHSQNAKIPWVTFRLLKSDFT